MRILGPIVRLQIQRSSLKIGEKPNRRYDPAPLLSVDQLLIDADGAAARLNGTDLLDVHNRRHPASKNSDGENTLSMGFTAHYWAMQERFGEHMMPGCAGENILVEVAGRVDLADVAGGFVVMAPDGRERLRLLRVSVAHPCRPFSGFAHRHQMVEPEVLKETLQFLDGGTRGFYCSPETPHQVSVQIGDIVAAE